MRFYTSGLTYPEACDLRDELKAAGIDSNITVGALAINALDDSGNWDDWDDRKKTKWLLTVKKVVGGRCSYSAQLPLSQRLVVDRDNAVEELRALGVDIK